METEASAAMVTPQTPASVSDIEDYYPLLESISREKADKASPEDVYTQLSQKEHDLLLAAELGKALLNKNDGLKWKNEQLAETYDKQLQELSQAKHELESRLEVAESRYAVVVQELQADVSRLHDELQRAHEHTKHDASTTSYSLAQHAHESEQLAQQLLQATEREKQLEDQVCGLREQMGSGHTSIQEQGWQLESLQQEICMLTAERAELERRVESVMAERDSHASSVSEAEMTVRALEAHQQEQQQRLMVQEQEISELQEHNSILQDKLRLLQMTPESAEMVVGGESLYRELSMQSSISLDSLEQHENMPWHHPGHVRPTWLPLANLSDGNDMAAADMGSLSADSLDRVHMLAMLNSPLLESVESFQLKQELLEVYNQLRQMVHRLQGLTMTCTVKDPALTSTLQVSTQQQHTAAPRLRIGMLMSLLSELRTLMECIVNMQMKRDSPATSKQMDALTDQVDMLHAELGEANTQLGRLQLSVQMKDLELRRKNEELAQLHSKVKLSLQHQELRDIQAQRDHLQDHVAGLSRDEIVEQARRSRDDAFVKRNAMEIELERAKLDLMDLDGQLKEAIEQKLQLSQQLEQWKMDMQELVDTQMNKRMELEAKKSEKKLNKNTPNTGNTRRKFKLFSRDS